MSKFMNEFNNLMRVGKMETGSMDKQNLSDYYSIPLGVIIEELQEQYKMFQEKQDKLAAERLIEVENLGKLDKEDENDYVKEGNNNDDIESFEKQCKEFMIEEALLLKEAERQTMLAADLIKSDDERTVIEAVVGNITKELVDGINCNIIQIPVLDKNLLINIGLNVQDITIDAKMESINDIELLLEANIHGDGDKPIKTKLYELVEMGLVLIIDDILDMIPLTPLEYRGLSKMVDYNELTSLME